VCDGRSAVVGSLNLDYRSLAHNFENGVLIMENGAVAAARNDVLSTVSISHELSLCDLHPSLIKRAARLIAGVVLPIL
jgi:cardiolipin synthase